MLIPKKNRTNIYEYLFKEGVMVAKKDFNAPRHPDLETVPNLQVIKAMQVLYTTFTLHSIFSLVCLLSKLCTFHLARRTRKTKPSELFLTSSKLY